MGKGSTPRPIRDKEDYDRRFDKVFRKKKKKKEQGFNSHSPTTATWETPLERLVYGPMRDRLARESRFCLR